MGTFWLNFAVTEAISLAESFVNQSNLKPGLKTALEKLIEAGQAVVAAIQSKA